ncbi:ComEA family DNA-binding protein [Dietzia cinnamea]|uniref:Competence protein ComEA n=1 Tax=Dietzia cinnamea TaxID=321318 RepID=A0A4R3ZZU9_9ACTN|nr:ComEA family DNA-binding protein [Dietzia cinnamea]TCW26685.1 competence protein ComEA [Dietzia cinnamea]
MRTETRARPADPERDPARAAALQRLAGALAPEPVGRSREPAAAEAARVPWAEPDPDGARPERVPAEEPDIAAWADPPWWARIRWAPDRLAGVALVVVVLALGAFSVHRLLAAVPAGPPVPELPLAASDAASVGSGPAPTPPAPPAPATAAPGADPDAAEGPLVVSVVGLVGRSGLVTLTPGARVADALDSAGGVLEGGDRDGLNLARRVADGEQILVGLAPGPDGPRGPRSDIVGPGPAQPPAAPGAPAAGAPAPAPAGAGAGPVDLNTADAAALESLPGIGPVTAAAILAWRSANGVFTSVDQLVEVDGIGPATLAKLRPLVTV